MQAQQQEARLLKKIKGLELHNQTLSQQLLAQEEVVSVLVFCVAVWVWCCLVLLDVDCVGLLCRVCFVASRLVALSQA